MFRLSAVALILLQAYGAAVAADRQKITVQEKTLWVQTRTDQQKHCGPNPTTEACTHFVDRRPLFVCSASNDQWRIEASANVTALIILRRPGTALDKRAVVEHERLHIRDIRQSLDEYLLAIEQRRYVDGESCRETAESEARAFDDRLRTFTAASSALRD